ncbi:S49 family peptidase [Chenggangzhangella methanolivorans]|uniref:S49 family peptidase n=1 Tax=Chenggangzhangella methanolivorans TaxID=1437009 RepID=A0A9E6R844_9HYPH|nr:S49 family peptidase [Chenggangzhangella methanolivorans]QZN99788.1 S49 family peptidase [Chenggangzhangella methanolivorans]
MTDLDLALRTPGRALLLEPRAARAHASRLMAAERPRRSRGLVAALAGAVGFAKDDAAPEKPEALVSRVEWASEVAFGAGFAICGPIAVIDVSGVLTAKGYYDWWNEEWVPGYRGISAAIAAARADERVSAILLREDSPGGLVSENFDLCDEIHEGSARNGGKPIWAHVSSLCCSAAYSIAASCDRVLASREAEIGSIGVVIVHVDESELLKDWGLRVEAIESAPGKTMGAPWKPLDDATREHWQADVDELAGRFSAVVERGRGLSAEQIKALDARYFLADHADAARSALSLGLVDEILTERAAAAALLNSLSLPDGTGTPAAAGASRAASRPRKEQAMSKIDAAMIAALEAEAESDDEETKSAADDKLGRIKAILDEEDEDKDDEEASTEDDDETEAKANAKAGRGKAKASASTGVAAVMAVFDLPEARGREKLARSLAAKAGDGKISVEEAKEMLAASPKASRLGEAMEGRDKGLKPDAPAGDAEALVSGVMAMYRGKPAEKRSA